ncbi:MAG: WYL domain-containing protein [Actinomycetota bacterium]|nr:WYL domain-containing protein [Actinomycetota bacterium]
MQRLERLLNLTAALLTAPRPLTRDDIRERVPGYPGEDQGVGTFRRAFERDKETLRDMGIPVVLAEVPGTNPPAEGYLIRRDEYELADPGLEPDELAAVHLASAAVELEGLAGTEALWKLGGAPAPAAPGRATADFAALPATPQLVPLFSAVAERRPVAFAYRGEGRSVDPWRLSFSRGHWYLEGWDHVREAERQFRLDRMEGAVTLGEAGRFERPPATGGGAVRPWELGGDDPVRARVRIDADQAGWAVDHLGEDAVVAHHPDGAVEVELQVSSPDGFLSFVLGFLDHAEVLAPASLRQAMADWLRALANGH